MRQHYFVTPFAESGDRVAVPSTVQVDGSVSYPEGFGPPYQLDLATNPAALAVPRDKSNEIYYDITLAVQALQQGVAPEWITAANNNAVSFPYAIGARAYYSDNIGVNPFYEYVSQQAANTGTPITDPTKWRRANPFGDLPGLGAALTSGGAPNIQTLSPTVPIDSYQAYTVFEFIAGFTNTGPLTLNISGLGAKNVKVDTIGGIKALRGGELTAGNYARVRYDGVQLILLTCSGLQFPNTVGAAGQPLTSNADGTLAWAATTGTGAFVRSADPAITGVATVAAQYTSGFQIAGVASGAWTTLFAPSDGAFLVFCNTNNQDSQTGVAIFASTGGSITMLWQSGTGNITFRVSGTDIQAEQTNGAGQTLTGIYMRINAAGVW